MKTCLSVRIGMVLCLTLVGCGASGSSSSGAGGNGGTGGVDGGAGASGSGGTSGSSGTGGFGAVSGSGGSSGVDGGGATGGAAGSDAGSASCTDGVKNGDETDVDCGGSCPNPCADGSGCTGNSDCTSGVCRQGVCQTPTCIDGVKNGDETGTDCGGPTCPDKCPDGSGCTANSDCTSDVCDTGTSTCVPANCTDGVKNGNETDVDCGGSCAPCADTSACNTGADCTSGVCTGGVCQAATCSDGVKNQDESDVDCGGATCPGCGVGSTCNTWNDCATKGCLNGHCIIPCAAGDIECNGNTAQVCDGHGGYTANSDCAAASLVCVNTLGCVTCVPGTGSCSADTGTYCKSDGSGYATETCDSAQGMSCNGSTGRCEGACAPAVIGQSYQGCDYFPTVTANLVSTTFHFAVAVSNTASSATSVTVTKGAATVSTVSVAANSVQIIDLPWVASLKGPTSGSATPFPASIQVSQGAYRLRSTQPVTVYQFSPLEYTLNGGYSYTNDASLLLPTNAWGPEYRAIARHHWYSDSGFVAVTAAQDNTVVTFTKGPQSGNFKTGVTGVNASGVGTVTLNSGDVVELVSNGAYSNSDPNDPTGLLVSATKPVQVIGGHQCTDVPDAVTACDHLEDSIFPIQTLSNKYVVVAPRLPGNANPKVEMVRIVSTQSGTTLTYDPPQAGAPASIANAGGWVEIASNANSFAITASHPVYVMQYMEGQSAGGGAGDPAMAQAVTPAQYRTDYLFHAPTNYSTNFVNVIAPTGATVTLDGTAVGGFAAIGGSGFSATRVQLGNGSAGNHTISASAPVGISVYGYGSYTSYWYPGGLDLQVLPQN